MTDPAGGAIVRLRIEPLLAAAFAPFGDVLAHDPDRGRSVNAGLAWRSDMPAPGDHAPGASPALALYRVLHQTLPLSVDLFERHPQSSQVFASLTVARFLAVVAPASADGLPDAERARAFLGGPGQALRYRRDQWHAPMIALDAGGDMLMLAWEHGTAGDCVEHRLPAPLIVTPRS